MTAYDVGVLILRVALGLTMAAHGYNKFFGPGGLKGTAGWFDSMGMKPGIFHARIAATTEMSAGIGLARTARKWSSVSAWVTMSSSPRPSYSSSATWLMRLEPAAEAALGLAHALDDGPHLAVALGHEHDDAVGLAEPDRPQHDALVAVRAPRLLRPSPKRRSRRWNSRTASKRCSRRKSGHSTSVKTSSL